MRETDFGAALSKQIALGLATSRCPKSGGMLPPGESSGDEVEEEEEDNEDEECEKESETGEGADLSGRGLGNASSSKKNGKRARGGSSKAGPKKRPRKASSFVEELPDEAHP